ncbi:MAG: hypothetical protein EU548_03050 [Promethearchaeota archaeon]|nr:MAG: hypothetical protein EU548_03050 [Candidatus Lokiarchaeota archaeon]
MDAKSNLMWKDIVSPTMTPDDYMEQYKDKIALNYKAYKPKIEILQEITQIIASRDEKLRIAVLGADWCPDCNKNIPRMIKIVRNLDEIDIEFKILYGIMVNALHKPEEPIWHKTRSPPEATDPKFDLNAIPTFYFFNKKGNYLGQIIENPQQGNTLEEDTLDIIKGNI